MTYAELTQILQDYAENAETTYVANIDNFIQSAEEAIVRKVKVPSSRVEDYTTMTASSQFLDTPSGFLSPYYMYVVNGTDSVFLLNRDADFIRSAYPDPASEGVPKVYALYDEDSFIVAPTPDDNYTVRMGYYKIPTSLTAGASSGTTWISNNAENALLYGSLMFASSYLKEDADTMADIEKKFADSIQDAVKLVQGDQKRDSYLYGEERI